MQGIVNLRRTNVIMSDAEYNHFRRGSVRVPQLANARRKVYEELSRVTIV